MAMYKRLVGTIRHSEEKFFTEDEMKAEYESDAWSWFLTFEEWLELIGAEKLNS